MHLDVESNGRPALEPPPSASPARPLVCAHRLVDIPAADVCLHAECVVPPRPRGLILFADADEQVGSETAEVASLLRQEQLATLLFTLRMPQEALEPARASPLIDLFAHRLVEATRWAARQLEFSHIGLGYLASGWGAAAALKAVTLLPPVVDAVVCRAGRFDAAADYLDKVEAAVSLVVTGPEDTVAERTREAFERLNGEKELAVLGNAKGHTNRIQDEARLRQRVSNVAAQWFKTFLRGR